MQSVRFFLDRAGVRSNSARSTGMSYQEIFSLKLSHNFHWIIIMTSQDSTDEQDTFLTYIHLNT